MIRPVYRAAVLFAVSVPHIVLAQVQQDALVLYREGRYQQAVQITLDEIAQNPANLDSYTVLGWSLLALERYEDAIDYGTRGLDVSQFDHRLVHIVGVANVSLGNDLEAIEHLQNYIALAPRGSQIAQVYYLLGETHLRLREYHRADIAFTTAVTLNDRPPTWWMRLGFARERAERFGHAIDAYQAALARDPSLTDARAAIARLSS